MAAAGVELPLWLAKQSSVAHYLGPTFLTLLLWTSLGFPNVEKFCREHKALSAKRLSGKITAVVGGG